jgi:hypothetical protein
LAELVLVFVSVYAAFWLNNYQQHQQEINRPDQILASLEQGFRRGTKSGRIAAAKEERQSAEFRRALNLDQDISLFYDPATKKLRKRFEIYPQALDATVTFAHDLDRTKNELLNQIRAERKRR